MVKDISGLGSPNRNELRTSNGASSSERSSAESTESTSSNAVGDQVELSAQSKALKALEQQLSGIPDVDQERVAAIKNAVDSGQYQVNDQSIADKLLSTEALLSQ